MRRFWTMAKVALILVLLMVFSGQALAWGIEEQPLFTAGVAAPGDVTALDGTYPRCISGCNAKDLDVYSVWLDSATSTCTPGEMVTAVLKAQMDFNTVRYCTVLVADLYIDGQQVRDDYIWQIGTASAGLKDYTLETITWTCGQTLELRDILLEWDNTNGTACDYNSCTRYTVPSKCWQSANLIIVAPLAADFSATEECEGDATQFTDDSTGGLAPYTYNWNFGDGSPTSALQNPTHTYAAAGDYSVTLTVTDSSVPPVIDSQTHTVSVIECCTLESVTVVPDLDYDPEVCGSVGTLTANVVGGEGPFTYQWYDGTTLIGTTNPLEDVILEPGDHSIYVVVTDTARENCAATSPVVPLTALDVYPPDVSCPEDIVRNADPGKCTALVAFVVPVDDNCELASIRYYADGVEIDDSHDFPVGETTVQVVATDVYGNVNRDCTFTVTVTDAQKPTITCPAPVSVNADPGKCYATGVDLGQPTVGDNCGVASVTNNAPAQFPVGQTTVTWTVTDIHGNSQTCTQLVTVTDAQKPTITCPAPVSVNADPGKCYATGVDLGEPTTGDNCGVASVTNNAPAQFPVGQTTVTWTVTDIHGNSQTCTQLVTVTDAQKPTISCPANISVNAPQDQCQAMVDVGQPTVADNCPGATVEGVRSDNKPLDDPYPVGLTTITWTVTDAAGNTATCQQKVTVADNQAPTITCPQDISTSADAGQCGAEVTFEASARDNCAIASVKYYVGDVEISSPARFPVGTTTVDVVATDVHGNSSNCSFDVTVNDTQAPTVTCPGDMTVPNTPGQCGAEVTFQASAADNCGVATIKYYVGETEISLPHTFPVGTTTVAAIATDVHGNRSVCRFNVTVTDTEAPSIICPPDIVQDFDRGMCSATVEAGDPAVDDNCGVAEIMTMRSDGAALNAPYYLGVTTITRTVTDIHGNKATCTQEVTIEDQSPTVLKIVKYGPAVAAEGDTVTYTFAVSHDKVNGDGAPVDAVAVVDDLAGPATYVSGNDADSVLEMGETWIYAAQYTVPEGAPNEIVNTATVTGLDCDGDTVTAQASHTLLVARAELGQPQDWHDPHCAGWRQRYTVTFTNSGGAALTNVVLSAAIPAEATFDVPSSSDELIVDDATHAHWEILSVQPGEVVELYLEIRVSTTMAGKTLTTCFTLDADYIDPITACEDSQVVRCEGPTPTPEPTSTPKPTKTPTPKPTMTPTATPTQPLPNDGRVIWLPIIQVNFGH